MTEKSAAKTSKKKSREDLAFPVATIPSLTQPARPVENPLALKKIIQGAIKGAYCLKTPTPSYYDEGKKQEPLVSEEQVQLVTHLIESLQPTNAIEAALAAQFAITYVRGLEESSDTYGLSKALELFGFSHQVLEALQKFRSKGAQLISVNYNHNQGQINNIQIVEKDDPQQVLEV